jgi:hypothetical protein
MSFKDNSLVTPETKKEGRQPPYTPVIFSGGDGEGSSLDPVFRRETRDLRRDRPKQQIEQEQEIIIKSIHPHMLGAYASKPHHT